MVNKMDTKEKTISGFIIAIALVAGFFGNGLIDQDTPIYDCVSKGISSDCINGVKADGIRCYYNETNKYKYVTCPEAWELRPKGFIEEPIAILPTIKEDNVVKGTYVICDLDKCIMGD